jgi:hypothetical protein
MQSLNFQYQENHLYLVKDEVKDITSGVRSIQWECPAITEHTLSAKGPVFCLATATVKHPKFANPIFSDLERTMQNTKSYPLVITYFTSTCNRTQHFQFA